MLNSNFTLIRKLRIALELIEEIYKSPATGERNKELIERKLKIIHEKPTHGTSTSNLIKNRRN